MLGGVITWSRRKLQVVRQQRVIPIVCGGRSVVSEGLAVEAYQVVSETPNLPEVSDNSDPRVTSSTLRQVDETAHVMRAYQRRRRIRKPRTLRFSTGPTGRPAVRSQQSTLGSRITAMMQQLHAQQEAIRPPISSTELQVEMAPKGSAIIDGGDLHSLADGIAREDQSAAAISGTNQPFANIARVDPSADLELITNPLQDDDNFFRRNLASEWYAVNTEEEWPLPLSEAETSAEGERMEVIVPESDSESEAEEKEEEIIEVGDSDQTEQNVDLESFGSMMVSQSASTSTSETSSSASRESEEPEMQIAHGRPHNDFARFTFMAKTDVLNTFPHGDEKHVYAVPRGLFLDKFDNARHFVKSTGDICGELFDDFTAALGKQFSLESKPWTGKVEFGRFRMPNVFGSDNEGVAFSFSEEEGMWNLADPLGKCPRRPISFQFTTTLTEEGVHILDIDRSSYRYIEVSKHQVSKKFTTILNGKPVEKTTRYWYYDIEISKKKRRTASKRPSDWPRYEEGDFNHVTPAFYGGEGETIRVGAYIYGEDLWAFSRISVLGEITKIPAAFLAEVITSQRHVGAGAISNIATKLGINMSPAMRNLFSIICTEKQTIIPSSTGTDWAFIPQGVDSPEDKCMITNETANGSQNVAGIPAIAQKRMVGGTISSANSRTSDHIKIQVDTYEAVLKHTQIWRFEGKGNPSEILKETTRQAEDAIRCADEEVDADRYRSSAAIKTEPSSRIPGKPRIYCVMNPLINSLLRAKDVLQPWAKALLESLHFGRRKIDVTIYGRTLFQLMNGEFPDTHTSTDDARKKVRELFGVDLEEPLSWDSKDWLEGAPSSFTQIRARLVAGYERGQPFAHAKLDMSACDSSCYGTGIHPNQDRDEPTINDELLEGIAEGENRARCAGDCVAHLWLTLLHPDHREELVSALNELQRSAAKTKFSVVDFDGILHSGTIDMSSMTVSGSLLTSMRNSIIVFLFTVRLTAEVCFADIDNIPIEDVYELREFWDWMRLLVRVHGDDALAVLPRTKESDAAIIRVGKTFGLTVKNEGTTFSCVKEEVDPEFSSLMPDVDKPVFRCDYAFMFLGTLYARRDTLEVTVPNPTRLMENLAMTPNTTHGSRVKYALKMAASLYLLRPEPGTETAKFMTKTLDVLLSLARETTWWKNDTSEDASVVNALYSDFKLSVIYGIAPEGIQPVVNQLLAAKGPGVAEIINALHPDGYCITKDNEEFVREMLEEQGEGKFFSHYIPNGWLQTQSEGYEEAAEEDQGVLVKPIVGDRPSIPGHHLSLKDWQVKESPPSNTRTLYIPTLPSSVIKSVEEFQLALNVYMRTQACKGVARGKIMTSSVVYQNDMLGPATNPVWMWSVDMACKNKSDINPILERALSTVLSQYLAELPREVESVKMQAWGGVNQGAYTLDVFRNQEIKCTIKDSFVSFGPATIMRVETGDQVKDEAIVRKREDANRNRQKRPKGSKSSKGKAKAKASRTNASPRGRVKRGKKARKGMDNPSTKRKPHKAQPGSRKQSARQRGLMNLAGSIRHSE